MGKTPRLPKFKEKLYFKTHLGQPVALLIDQRLKGLLSPSPHLIALSTWQVNPNKDRESATGISLGQPEGRP